MCNLICGKGEIGKSLYEVFRHYHETYIRDIEETVPYKDIEVLHIAYPYSSKFVKNTKAYIRQYNPKLVIVHSSIPVGTTRKLGDIAVYSPVNGRHPDLVPHIKSFKKIVGGVNPYQVFEAIKFLKGAMLDTVVFSSPEAAELAKILCTRRYGVSIIEMKETATLCQKFDVPFHEVYSQWNMMYNEGYTKVGEVRFHRPNLVPMKGPTGGHCVIPNLEFVKDELSEFIKSRNEVYKGVKHDNRKKHNNLEARTK